MNLLKKVTKKFLKPKGFLTVGILNAHLIAAILQPDYQVLSILPPPPPPHLGQQFNPWIKILSVLAIPLAIIISIVGLFWLQINKSSSRWFHFFTSKTFSATITIIVLLSFFLWKNPVAPQSIPLISNLVAIATISSIISIVWYQLNEPTKKWFHFFISKTFFITIAIATSCIIYLWNNLSSSATLTTTLMAISFFGSIPFVAISTVWIIWYQENKLTQKWSKFFTSKPFFITIGLSIFLMCYFWLIFFAL